MNNGPSERLGVLMMAAAIGVGVLGMLAFRLPWPLAALAALLVIIVTVLWMRRRYPSN